MWLMLSELGHSRLWRMSGVILRPDTEFPAFCPSVQSKESTGNATFIWSQIGIFLLDLHFINVLHLYKCASIFFLSPTLLWHFDVMHG